MSLIEQSNPIHGAPSVPLWEDLRAAQALVSAAENPQSIPSLPLPLPI